MRLTILTAALCALPIALVVAVPAQAATGTLTIGNQTHTNPSGCYNSSLWPMIVKNDTDQPALVYADADCGGVVLDIVPPGGSTVSEFGRSVRIE